jgi:uncharacterized protein
MIETLSLSAVRAVQLANQGLLTPPAGDPGKDDVLNTIRRIGALQIDTISVVARAPYFILWSRLGSYPPTWLEDLLAKGQLFEYWAHAACFLPIEDYPLYRRFMLDKRYTQWRNAWGRLEEPAVEAVLARIRAEGPLRSADFERKDGKNGTWWDWKEEKEVLEYLFTTGVLAIRARKNFQRIYDLTERIMPGWDDARALPEEAVIDELTLRTVRILGVTQARWVFDYFRLPKKGMPERLDAFVDRGQLLRFSVEGWDQPAYVHPDQLGLVEAAQAGQLQPTLTTLLCPFDPLISDRTRASQVFGFDYSIEVYLPAPKRVYGYYVLPILHRGALVGRLDAKANRQAGRFEVKALYLEPGVTPTPELSAAILDAIQRCAAWHATPEISIQNSQLPL